MDYTRLLARARPLAAFGDDIFFGRDENRGTRTIQLSRWAKAGKILRLKRGLYTLPEEFRKAPLSLRWLANALYSPSCLSLEYVLSWCDLIPERVSVLTSVTPLKTAAFSNALGRFTYRTVKPDYFFGFEELRDEFGQPVLVATPEKALLDFIYLHPGWENTEGFLAKNLRLQQLDQLKATKLKAFAARFGSRKMREAARFLAEVR